MKPFINYIPPNWDVVFMRKVYEISLKSKDPRSKMGAVFVKNNHSPLEGYNGIPRGVVDNTDRMTGIDKFQWIEHAERNVINMAAFFGISTHNGYLYTQEIPCVYCTKGIINSGIKGLVLHKPWENYAKQLLGIDNWNKRFEKSTTMFIESNVSIRYIDDILNVTGYIDGYMVDL